VLSFKNSFCFQFFPPSENIFTPAKVNIIWRDIAQSLMIPLAAGLVAGYRVRFA